MGFESGRLLRVTLSATKDDGSATMVNTLHYDLRDGVLGVSEPNDPQQLADTIRDDVLPPYSQCFGNNWHVQPVVIIEEKDPLNPLALREGWTSGAAIEGISPYITDLLPIEVCAVATLHTGKIGRRARGRLFMMGERQEGEQAAGVWNTLALSPWQAVLDAIPRQPDIATGVSDSTADWTVYSRTQRAANLDGYANKVTGVTLHDKVHWLRSRGR